MNEIELAEADKKADEFIDTTLSKDFLLGIVSKTIKQVLHNKAVGIEVPSSKEFIKMLDENVIDYFRESFNEIYKINITREELLKLYHEKV